MTRDIIDDARAVPIGEVAGVELRRVGGELVGPRPVCGGRDRFGISLRKCLWNCRQCEIGGDVIALAMHVHGVDFRGAVELLTGGKATASRPKHRVPPEKAKTPPDDARIMANAERIWIEAMPIVGTPGEDWLVRRGILLDDVPDRGGLRFHPRCPYGPGRAMRCILARFTDALTGASRGLHRRVIAPGMVPKTMTLGPMAGAAVRLWPDDEVTEGLVVGEGIETVLAAATRIEHRGTLLRPAWACATAGNLEALPVLAGIEALMILADADENGRGQEAARRCAERWSAAGREVTILTPRQLGLDFNDIVVGAA
jgi:hypothetical protein